MSTEQHEIVRLPQATHMSQVTAVEQARAVAEVAAAIEVARRFPRDWPRAERDMQRACQNEKLADMAFYQFNRGRTPSGRPNIITGPSVQLARELARCFGNVQYGLIELRRDAIRGESEMQAWAWDVETNVRASTTFVSPHVRDRSADKGGAQALTDVREIYENNANMGARRLREMIFSVLPGWFSDDAQDVCRATIAGQFKTEELPQRRDSMVAAFARFGVSAAQLENKLGAPPAHWTAYDLAQCQITYRSLERQETTVEAEFGEPPQRQIAVPAGNGAGDQADKPGERKRNNRAEQAMREIADVFVRFGLGTAETGPQRLAVLRRMATGPKSAALEIADPEQLTDAQVMVAAKNLKAAVAEWEAAERDPAEELAAMAGGDAK